LTREEEARRSEEELRAVEEAGHERIDPLRDSGPGQRRANKAARALKFYIFGQRHGCGDNFGRACGPGDGVVEGVGRIEANRCFFSKLLEVLIPKKLRDFFDSDML
jgi:hypothetical protein